MKSKNKYFNPNPLKKETTDCVTRALCALEGAEWDDVFRELFEIAFELKVMPEDKEAYSAYLTKHGYTRHKVSNKKGTKRPKMNEMATRSKTEGPIFCELANHAATVKDGYILDIWDCGECSLYGYWMK